MTEIMSVNESKPELEVIRKASDILQNNGTVVFPTETVYGLGANGLSSTAVQKIFDAKMRPNDNPLILHVHSLEQVNQIGIAPKEFYQLAEKFWPGPLTMIIPKNDAIPHEVSRGLETVAVRMPDHSIALSVIREANLPIAAPSANISGRPSPTSFEHVNSDLNGRVDMIIDGGETGVGLESTVIDLSTKPFTILRPGGITFEDLESVLTKELLQTTAKIKSQDQTPKSPGLKYRHYAPKGELFLVDGEGERLLEKIKELVEKYSNQNYRVGVLVTDELKSYLTDNLSDLNHIYMYDLGPIDNLNQVAKNLYNGLREMDNNSVEIIFCRTFPKIGMGTALMNRLKKAARDRIL
ncbi:L-threonylcarbamoyladenylate synthase [Natranaerobius trueperi]|uniref:Threonylcarbamoyl-AMP synthase n=1 Tax=Natranaerobius trueperi TaxID=759412 RepID=A0A226C2C1_9FIRM|nr:L-threonylcarbamoyladenylate synthase [Natranaerobius trueperi]OWZ84589.1 threonylcarbamoyl-AMP synthase [Natranaerobius trueperi]